MATETARISRMATKVVQFNKLGNSVGSAFTELFHCIPRSNLETPNNVVAASSLIARGIVFLNEDGTVAENVFRPDAVTALYLFGLKNSDWLNSLHTSWDKILDAPMEQLLFEQIVHYFSTYGLESLGKEANPLFPLEKICVDLDSSANVKALTVIRYVSEEEAANILAEYLARTAAPHKDMFEALVGMANEANIHPDNIRSFELKVARYKEMGIVLNNGQDFLRYLIYELTGNSMLVKNAKTVNEIKRCCNENSVSYNAFKAANLVELSKCFYRFKPLFLAFRADKRCRPYINRIRKLAISNHQPMREETPQNLMNLMYEAYDKQDYTVVDNVIAGCSVRKAITIMNFIRTEIGRYKKAPVQIGCSTPVPASAVTEKGNAQGTIFPLYFIRNGKVFVRTSDDCVEQREETVRLLLLSDLNDRIRRHLQSKLRDKLADKVFYIPSEMHYAAPTSEKQFVGNIPYGSYIELPEKKDLCIAVRWENVGTCRVDLDLHMYSATRAFGWNAGYRSESRDILYSGDVTDAWDGAVEAYRYQPSTQEKFIVSISEYYGPGKVDFKLFMTSRGFDHVNSQVRENVGVCDIEDALFSPISLVIEGGDMGLGLVDKNRFFFFGGKMSQDRFPKRELYASFIESFANKLANMTDVREIINMAGGKVVSDSDKILVGDEKNAVIDLSASHLTSRSLMDIVDCAEK